MAALLGILVGSLLEGRRESRSWLRDAKLRTNTLMIHHASEILQAIRDTGEATTPNSRKEAATRYLHTLESFRAASSEAQLVGSPKAWRSIVTFNTVTNSINSEWYDPKKWPKPDIAMAGQDWEPWKTLKTHTLAMFDALREDLGEKPIPEFERSVIE